MTKTNQKPLLVLGLAPCSRGMGFAVLEGEHIIEWGVKLATPDKNQESLEKSEKLIFRYHPDKIIVEDYSSPGSKRAVRIRELGKRLFTLAERYNVKIKAIPRKRIFRLFLGTEKGTKYSLVEAIATRFPEDLGHHLPPRRRPWTSEDSRADAFMAVALALAGQS